jgi:hypothetical protein
MALTFTSAGSTLIHVIKDFISMTASPATFDEQRSLARVNPAADGIPSMRRLRIFSRLARRVIRVSGITF